MGIDNFHTWLKKRYSDVFVQTCSKNTYDYVYMDINHILHNSMYRSVTEKDFFNKLTHNLNIQFCNFLPTKKVIFAVDGPAPYSKVVLQRKRRLQSVQNVDMGKLNYLHITPGTPLMKKLNLFLEEYGKFLTAKLSKNIEFVVLPTNEPDEGEIKILKHLIKIGQDDPYSSHLIVGNDADLVVLAMSLTKIYDIHLFVRIKNHYELISIKRLINCICKEVINYESKSQYIHNNKIRADFAVVMIMAGNDYLPKIKYTKLEKLWETYIKTFKILNKNLIKDGRFDFEFLDRFMSNLLITLPKQYKYSADANDQTIRNYLEGLLWCLNMYQTGYCPKYDYYHGSDGVSPADILYFIARNKNIDIPKSDTKPLSSDIYTLLIMPQHAKKLIPPKLQTLINKDLMHIFSYENCKDCLHYRNLISKQNKYQRELSAKIDKFKDDKDNKDDKQLNKQYDKVKKEVSRLSVKFTNHRTTHKSDFTIDDVVEIIQYTEKNNLSN